MLIRCEGTRARTGADGVGELFVAFGGDRAGCHCVDRADPSAPMIPLMEPMLTIAPSPRCAIAGAMSPVSRTCGDADAERGNDLAGSDVCGGSRLHEGGDVNRPCCAAVLRLPARQSAGGVSVRVARLDRDVTSSAAAEIAQFKEVQRCVPEEMQQFVRQTAPPSS